MNKYEKILNYTNILFNKFYVTEKAELMDSAGRILFELRNEITEDQNARFLVYAELYRLTKDQNNKELTNIILKELLTMVLDDSINLKTAKETEIIREQIEKFAAY